MHSKDIDGGHIFSIIVPILTEYTIFVLLTIGGTIEQGDTMGRELWVTYYVKFIFLLKIFFILIEFFKVGGISTPQFHVSL